MSALLNQFDEWLLGDAGAAALSIREYLMPVDAGSQATPEDYRPLTTGLPAGKKIELASIECRAGERRGLAVFQCRLAGRRVHRGGRVARAVGRGVRAAGGR